MPHGQQHAGRWSHGQRSIPALHHQHPQHALVHGCACAWHAAAPTPAVPRQPPSTCTVPSGRLECQRLACMHRKHRSCQVRAAAHPAPRGGDVSACASADTAASTPQPEDDALASEQQRQRPPTPAATNLSPSSQSGRGGSNEATAARGDMQPQHSSQHRSGMNSKLLALIALVLVSGVMNRVLYKMALMPMGQYVFFLAQFQNLGYLSVYFSILALRWQAGLVTNEMLGMNKNRMWAIGACEALAQLLFMVSASHLPGPLLPVINQSSRVWNLLFAALFLKARFSKSQLAGTLLIMLGVVLAAMPASLWGLMHGGGGGGEVGGPAVQAGYVVLAVLCFAFPALASIIKDLIFQQERERLGRPLDIFMVNSFGSLFQAIFVLLLLPISLSLYGMGAQELPTFLGEGWRCFQGLAPKCGAVAAGSECVGAPLLPVAYVVANLTFNISMLTLLRSVGTVTTTIVGSCLVPLTILAFNLPLPFLAPSVMTPGFIAGVALLCAGLVTYNFHKVVKPLLCAMGAIDSVHLPAP